MLIQLKHFSYDCCPTCGARWVGIDVNTSVDGRVIQHINGGVWEKIRFACGRRDGYVPNFERVEIERPCSSDPLQIKQRKRREVAAGTLHSTLIDLDLTKEERERLSRDVRLALES